MAIDARTVNATELANWTPPIWSASVLAAVESRLVLGALCDRTYEVFATSGDTIVVPNLAEITANTVNTGVDMTLYSATQNVTNISLNKKYDIGVLVDDIMQVQNNPKYFEKVRTKLAYGLAKAIDSNVGGLIPSLDKILGTVNTAITEDIIYESYETLNQADAPFDDRSWVFSPHHITDLYKLDVFMRADYVGDVPVTTGFQGRKIMGSPVYITTNLPAYAGGARPAVYMHREALALVVQLKPRFEIARIPLQHGDAIIGLVHFGTQEMRGTFGVCINR